MYNTFFDDFYEILIPTYSIAITYVRIKYVWIKYFDKSIFANKNPKFNWTIQIQRKVLH